MIFLRVCTWLYQGCLSRQGLMPYPPPRTLPPTEWQQRPALLINQQALSVIPRGAPTLQSTHKRKPAYNSPEPDSPYFGSIIRPGSTRRSHPLHPATFPNLFSNPPLLLPFHRFSNPSIPPCSFVLLSMMMVWPLGQSSKFPIHTWTDWRESQSAHMLDLDIAWYISLIVAVYFACVLLNRWTLTGTLWCLFAWHCIIVSTFTSVHFIAQGRLLVWCPGNP